jgi:crossover junction endodeoxyribonuclease RusA
MTALSMDRRSVSFQVHGTARPKGSAQAFVPLSWAKAAVAQGKAPRAIVTTDGGHAAPVKVWQQLVAAQAQTVAADGLFLGAVVMTVVFALPRPISLPRKTRQHTTLPDLDKLLRAVLDALTGVLYADDKQVIELRARKLYAVPPAGPHARITVEDAAVIEPAQADIFEALA